MLNVGVYEKMMGIFNIKRRRLWLDNNFKHMKILEKSCPILHSIYAQKMYLK